jgi:hypothetical protein
MERQTSAQIQLACEWPFILLKNYVTKPGGIDTACVNQQTLCSIGHDAIARWAPHASTRMSER